MKISPSKNTFQNIGAWCLTTYNFFESSFLNLLKNIKRVNNKDKEIGIVYFFKKLLENFYY